MKGLLIKDLCLMKMQKRFFITIILIGIIMTASTGNIAFLLGYIAYIIPTFAVSAIGYDEFDNGFAFLFALPISKKLYVIEKYCFALLLSAASLTVGIALALVYGAVKDMPSAITAISSTPVIFALVLVFVSFMIPLQLKFGTEKSRVAMIILYVVIFLFGFGAKKLSDLMNINISSVLNEIQKLEIWMLAGCVLLALLAICASSIAASFRIIKKKQL